MSKNSILLERHLPVKKVMIYEPEPGTVYLFGYDTVLDRSGLFDEWHESIEAAERECLSQYGIKQKIELWWMIRERVVRMIL